MATTYTSTIEVKAWKEHTCAACGAVYSYLFVRKITGSAGNADRARENARKNAAKALAEGVDLQPCPTCGTYQQDMIGQERAKRHWVVFWLALIVLCVLVVLRLPHVLQANVATWAITATCAVAALAHLAIDFKNRNANLDANRQLAVERVSSGALKHTPGRPGTPTDDVVNPPRSMGHRLALALLLVSVLAAASPELLRAMQHWPLNEDIYPPVAGPGDSTRIYTHHKISSVKGYWRGTPEVVLKEEGSNSKFIPAKARTNENTWGSSISVKSSEKSTTSTPWVEVDIPNDTSLAGKIVNCDIDMRVSYPKISDTDSSSFHTISEDLSRTATIHLGPPGSGARYTASWWQGTLVGIFALLISGIMLRSASRGLRRHALPTRLAQQDAAAPPPPPPPLPQASRA